MVPRCSGADQEWSKKGHDSFSLAGKTTSVLGYELLALC